MSEAMILRDRLTSRFRKTKHLPVSVAEKLSWRSVRPGFTGTAHFLLREVKWPNFPGSQSYRRLSPRAHPEALWRPQLWLCSHPYLWTSSFAASFRPSVTPQKLPFNAGRGLDWHVEGPGGGARAYPWEGPASGWTCAEQVPEKSNVFMMSGAGSLVFQIHNDLIISSSKTPMYYWLSDNT